MKFQKKKELTPLKKTKGNFFPYDLAVNLPKVYQPKEVERKIYQLWQKSGFFNPDKLPGRRKKAYTIVIPPPNITGELHLGHALNASIQDILIRWKRMSGFKTLWLPGTDHAGIATQNVVEKELKKEGKTRFDLGREEFLKRVWQWCNRYGNIILEQFKKLGLSLDWSRTKFTLDKDYSRAVNQAFLHYYKKGWIYQARRTINWCPRCTTSLSDLEIEYKTEEGKFYFIQYGPLLVGTARPETKLGDTALAVNPNDKRYRKYIGKEITIQSVDPSIPLQEPPRLKEIKIKVIADKRVDPKFGTGVIKVTPAHDLTDFEIYQEHPEIPILQVIGQDGRMTAAAGIRYQGLTVSETRNKIVDDLIKLGLIKKVKDYTHNLAICYRCGTIIEPIPSFQWFLKMKKLAQMAKTPVKTGKIRFHPKNFEKPYFDWLKNIKDWCISRQIWWGHRLPIWQCQIIKKSKVKSQTSIGKMEDKGEAFRDHQKSKINKGYFISLKKPVKCPICKKCKPRQVEDVLDTWFSSALWPFAVFGWPKKTKDLKRFYPTDVLSTSRDIINLWVARMIFSGQEFMKREPFRDVYIHATVLTREGKRMSKSLGTGIDPINLIEKYGADATRFGIIWQVRRGQDIRFVEDNMIMGKKFCNKIWNASRFVLFQIGNGKSKKKAFNFLENRLLPNSKFQTLADKRILKALNETVKSVNKNLENFQFGQAAQKLYDFFWHDFCDVYIEESKKQQDLKTKKILLYVLLNSLKLLHPFMPFITEEIYQRLPIKNKKKSLMIEVWP